MSDKEFEWEIGYSKVHPKIEFNESKPDLTGKKTDPLVGQILDGRFLIEKNLMDDGGDAGGIGLVYLATDMKLMGKETVIKILQKSLVLNEDIARKFLHEKEALIRLDHPNIVRILDSGNLSDGNPFMVMEYIPGYSLRRVLKEKRKQSFDFIAHVVESVTDALSAAHSQKILHRDIKPENIMLTPQEVGFARIRLIDFGIARVEDSKLAPATVIPRGIGTILYIAPEQLLGKMEQTPAADIYAVAIVVYEMLTGELPFKPESIVEMFELQKEGITIPPSQLRGDLPAEAEQILLSALAFPPEERPPNARQFGLRLAKALRGSSAYVINNEEVMPALAETIAANPVNDQIIIETGPNPSVITIESPIERTATIPSETVKKFTEKTAKTETADDQRLRKFLLGATVAMALALVGIFAGLIFWASSDRKTAETIPPPVTKTVYPSPESNVSTLTAATEPAIELNYHLIVQKMRDGKPFEEPFRSSGQEIFENNYKFKMVFQTQADGYLYLFSQDMDEQGNNLYNILYPTPKTNNGSAQVFKNQRIETSANTFSKIPGIEIIWLIWTADQNAELEAVRQSAFNTQGVVADENSLSRLNDFLQKNKDRKNEIRRIFEEPETVIKTNGNVLVHAIELEHR